MPASQPKRSRNNGLTARSTVPLGTRLGGRIVKPKDWGAFQRNCVVLFREELKDPHAKEYGRNGQNQGGIDILGYRNADPNHAVGVQCRNVEKSLKQATILRDCRAALALVFGLREIIFATTAPNDTKAERAAKAVEHLLRGEGREVTIHVYGWEQLEILIGLHEVAYNAFMPTAVASSKALELDGEDIQGVQGLAAIVADEVAKRLGGAIVVAPVAGGPESIGDEDPALHAKIDLLRDLVRDGDGRIVEQRLIALRDGSEAVDAPWARYRIETNIAAAAIDQGRERDAAEAYVRAQAIRPDDPGALANLAIARTIQGRPDEGMRIAQKLLRRTDRPPFAVSALLQSASRSGWQGDPETLVPEDLSGSPPAELGLADFMRRRWLPGWERRVLALPDDGESRADIAHMKALAVLSIAVDSRIHVVGGKDIVSDADVDSAATVMLAHATRCLRNGYADRHDLMAHVSNAALLLRIAGRNGDAEPLLKEGLKALPGDEQLLRLLAMVHVDGGRRDDAVRLLESGVEPETVLMKVQFGRGASAAQRLLALQAMDEPLEDRVAGMRRRLMAELALAAGDDDAARTVIADMLAHPEDVVAGRLLDVQREQKRGLEQAEAQQRLRRLGESLEPDCNPIDRFLVAEAMLHEGMEGEAADLIEHHVDLAGTRPSTFLFLTALAEARRDDAYRRTLEQAPPAVREHPEVLWLDARHAWNAGDLPRSLGDLDRFLALKPDEPRAVLMRLEVLLRLGWSKQVLEALDRPIEDLSWTNPGDAFRVAALLGHFGQHERAARLAYRLFLEHRDQPRAWTTLSSITIREGRELRKGDSGWLPVDVAPDVAVDLAFDDGTTGFFIVEPDARLRSLDPESWEPNHALVRMLLGHGVDHRFVGPDGRQGRITQLRHKIVARFHYVLANYESRFPEVFAFRSMSIDPESPNGLDELVAQLKQRNDHVLEEQNRWLGRREPIDVLAARLCLDTIDVAGGLAQQGIKLRVAEGTHPERETAEAAVIANGRRGCVLDLLAFWTAWRLGVIDDVEAVCGPISIPRSVVDRLQLKRDHHSSGFGQHRGTLSYLEGGRVLHTEPAPGEMERIASEIDRALAWIEENGAAKPLVLDAALPDVLRRHVQSGLTDMLDATTLALASRTLLLCDDAALRAVHAAVGGAGSAWLHCALTRALVVKRMGAKTFVEHTVDLIGAGQTHLGISGSVIALGMEMDALEYGRLDRRTTVLVGRLGGAEAEPVSHVEAVLQALAQLWSTRSVAIVREQATGRLLEAVIRQRPDWKRIMAAVENFASGTPALRQYVRDWGRGHFLPGYA